MLRAKRETKGMKKSNPFIYSTLIIKLFLKLCVVSFILVAIPCGANSTIQSETSSDNTCNIFIPHSLKNDYIAFYRTSNLVKLASGFALMAVMANTSMDQSITDWYQKHIRSSATNGFSRVFKPFGSKDKVSITYLGINAGALLLRCTTLGCGLAIYSERFLEALVVGLPPLLVTQRLTGSSRPSSHCSHWHPFRQDHGVSGHTFLSALLFLTAAEMISQPTVKNIFYGVSTFTGLSRFNDNSHYLSQVILGWWLGYLSVKAVFSSKALSFTISPTVYQNGAIGVTISKALN